VPRLTFYRPPFSITISFFLLSLRPKTSLIKKTPFANIRAGEKGREQERERGRREGRGREEERAPLNFKVKVLLSFPCKQYQREKRQTETRSHFKRDDYFVSALAPPDLFKILLENLICMF
jgi:hypothetical protein